MKKVFNLIYIFGFIFLFSACATREISSVVPLNANNSAELYNSSIGVVVLTPNTEIEFSDMLYKVLFYEIAESFFSFDGLWDPGERLAQKSMQTLHEQFGMKTVSLRSGINPQVYDKYVKESKEIFNITRIRHKGTADPPAPGYSHEYLNNNIYLTSLPNKTLLKAADELDLQYIMEIPLTGIAIFSVCFNGGSFFNVYAHARLISVPDGRIVWAHKGKATLKVEGELLLNDLESIKSYYSKAINELCDSSIPYQIISRSLSRNYLFGNLAKEVVKKTK